MPSVLVRRDPVRPESRNDLEAHGEVRRLGLTEQAEILGIVRRIGAEDAELPRQAADLGKRLADDVVEWVPPLYEGAGMKVEREHVRYEKTLPAPGSSLPRSATPRPVTPG